MNAELRGLVDAYLGEHQDLAFREFNAKLLPSVDANRIIGVRTSALRALARRLSRRADVGEFLRALPHECFEENQLHAFIIGGLRDYASQLREVERFLPYVDNWATCDQLSCKTLPDRPEETLAHVRRWVASGETYTVRFGIGVLLQFFTDELFEPDQLQLVVNVRSQEYYVNMMRAWYVAELAAKQPEAAMGVIRHRELDVWTHNKAIQKARESRRVASDLKEQLRGMRVR